MEYFDRLIGKQIRKPCGILGSLFGYLMAVDHKAVTEWTLNQLRIQENDHVLDIGCGCGMAVKMIGDIVTQGDVVGIDYSPVMLRQAARRNRLAIKKSKTRICHGNVSMLPFLDESFNKVCSIETFYFWPDPPKNLQEVKRVMKPGGTIAISMDISKEGENDSEILNKAKRLGIQIYSGVEMKSLLLSAGFVNVTYEAIPVRGKGWLCAIGNTLN